jgi:hypothetical protein
MSVAPENSQLRFINSLPDSSWCTHALRDRKVAD